MNTDHAEFFSELTGHAPYDFQEALGQRILRGESLVFRAPTGSGKTWTTVAPFLYSLRCGPRLADRLIYALPLRSLASSLHATVADALRCLMPTSISAKDRAYQGEAVYCSLQMGGEKNDPFFEGDLIFCTIDQVLSGYLMMPLSLPRRLDNIVAGALPGSLLVLDEAHLMESGVALGTVIEMLDRFRGLTQFVLMTATMSNESLNWLGKKLGAVVPELPEAEMRDLPVQRTKKRVWRWSNELLTAEAIVSAHAGGRTLAIVNQVDRAQDLYFRLKTACRGGPTRVACLHSRFFAEDRERTERDLQPWFGKKASETDVILVTTQVVEAGMDISADHILTELAPMNALVQRAGRTARYMDRCEGTVTVFEVEKCLPYSDDDGEITGTRHCLCDLDGDGEEVDFRREQAWVEHVHGAVEKARLTAYENLHGRGELVETAIRTGERGYLSELVRKIDAVNILLSPSPESVIFDGWKWPRLLSVPTSAIWKLRETIERGVRTIWTAWDAEEESGALRFAWTEVQSAADLKGCWLIALGPEAASYSEDAGLRLGEQGREVPVRYNDQGPALKYQYMRETWIDHVTRVMGQAKKMAPANSMGARKLELKLALGAGTAENLVELSAALHDVGKLALAWQCRAWEYETKRPGGSRGEPLAHTTTGEGERGPKLPHHAVEGAFAAMPLLAGRYPNAAWAVASAIARHHSSRACRTGEFTLIPEADNLLAELGINDSCLRDGGHLLEFQELAGDLEAWDDHIRDWWPVYAYLVRRLRLADQAGTAEGVREEAKKA